MTPTTIVGHYLRAAALNDVAAQDRLPTDPAGTSADGLVDAALDVVLGRRFPAGHSVHEVTVLARKMCRRYPEAGIRVIDAEALLRHRLGEATPIDEIDDATVRDTKIMAFATLVELLGLYPAELDSLLAHAEALAVERGYAPTPLPTPGR